jgi:3-oxoacyl-[acyl-carrier-protein] synthase-3
MYKYLLNFIRCLFYPFYLLLKSFNNLFFNNSKEKTTPELKIIGTGCYLPKNLVSNHDLLKKIDLNVLIKRYNKFNQSNQSNQSKNEQLLENCSYDDLDKLALDKLANFISDYYGIDTRYHASEFETNSYMGAEAIRNACLDANIELSNIDMIINASVTMDEIIPDTSIKIHKELGLKYTQSFSVHSTCMSSMYAIKLANSILKSDPEIKTIAIVSSEKTSLSTNPSDPKTYVILGDIAAAMIVRKDIENVSNRSKITSNKFITLSEYCNDIKFDTGNIRHPSMKDYNKSDYYFKMNSFNLLNTIPQIFMKFASQLLFNNYKHIVIHQPSNIAIDHFKKIFPNEAINQSFRTVGNCVSACIPYNLHMLIHNKNKKLKRGDEILLFGIGAGINIGAINLIY